MVTRGAEAATALLLLVAPAAGSGSDGVVEHDVAFTIADPAVHESSGLADHGRAVYTVNDSGSDPLLYALDPRTGRTVGTTTYAREVVDTEALAVGRGRHVWVGDIGDNLGRRDSVAVYDVLPGRAGGRRFELVYPDGPRDAEALLAHPDTDRLFVVSKRVFGGVVYAAPRELAADHANALTPFARVPGLVTGGEFLPDGEHVVLRTYGAASVFTFPAFEPVGTITVPDQEQGEAISVGSDGRVLVSSEGVGVDVLRIDLPPDLTEPSAGPTAEASPEGTSSGPGSGRNSSPPGQASPGASTAGEAPADATAAPTDLHRSQGTDWRDGLRVLAGLAVVTVVGWRLRRLWRRDGR